MPITVDQLADYLNAPKPADPSPQRTEMQRAVDAAVAGITRMTGMLDGITVTAVVHTDGRGGPITLPYSRLASVGVVNGPGGAVAPGYVDLLAGVIEVPAATRGAWQVACTGTAWPAELVTAALDWAADMYDTQRRTLQAKPGEDPGLPTYALPNRVEQRVRPYRLPGAA